MDIASESDSTVIAQVMGWAKTGESKTLCFATVHMVMESYSRPLYRRVVNGADLVLPDGMPLVWCLNTLGSRKATRIYGPDTTEHVLARAAADGISVGFYGSTPETLRVLCERVREQYPRLAIVYACAPPFRPLTDEEDHVVTDEIDDSGARILFVGLGCPKQEQWMSEHRGRVKAVMLGVGAAFDFLAGTKRQAPRWMMGAGLEWIFRLVTEPRRLWMRYLKHNPHFLCLFALQLLGRYPAAK